MDSQTELTTDTRRDWAIAVLATVTWAFIILTAVAEVIMLGSLVTKASLSWEDKGQLYLSAVCFDLLWILCLLWQWNLRFSPSRAKPFRRWALALQTLLIGFITAAGWSQSGPWDGLLILVPVFVTWALWRGLLKESELHPDDQKEIDALLDQRDREIADAAGHRAARRREERKRAAMAQLNLIQAPSPTPPRQPQRATPWAIPQGKHEPLVYFLRNGNRIKIGTTTELRRRIRTLALRPEHVVLLIEGGQRKEQELHRRFAALRDGTTEWFRDEGALTQYIAEQIARAAAENGKP